MKEEIKEKLASAIEIWADNNFRGKPKIYLTALYFKLEKAFLDGIEEITNKTKDK